MDPSTFHGTGPLRSNRVPAAAVGIPRFDVRRAGGCHASVRDAGQVGRVRSRGRRGNGSRLTSVVMPVSQPVCAGPGHKFSPEPLVGLNHRGDRLVKSASGAWRLRHAMIVEAYDAPWYAINPTDYTHYADHRLGMQASTVMPRPDACGRYGSVPTPGRLVLAAAAMVQPGV